MLILFGTRRTRQTLGRAVHGCPRCQQQAWFQYTRTKSHFTLFFIPLIPLSSTTSAICGSCGFQQAVPNATADQTLAAARAPMQVGPPQAPPAYGPQGAPPPYGAPPAGGGWGGPGGGYGGPPRG